MIGTFTWGFLRGRSLTQAARKLIFIPAARLWPYYGRNLIFPHFKLLRFGYKYTGTIRANDPVTKGHFKGLWLPLFKVSWPNAGFYIIRSGGVMQQAHCNFWRYPHALTQEFRRYFPSYIRLCTCLRCYAS